MMQTRSPRMSVALHQFLQNRPRSSASLLVLLASGLLHSSPAHAQTTPRIASNAAPVQAADFVQRGVANYVYVKKDNAAQVTTSTAATILHWQSLDVGKDVSLNFKLPSATSRVLNKVDGGEHQNKTTIEGSLSSNGQVYIYNSNGIIFGKNARINVSSLVASSLKIDDDLFMKGIFSPTNGPTFYADGKNGALPGAILVEGKRNGSTVEQAAITAEENGLIVLLAPEVVNQGQLKAPDGQVLMAAGTKVYLAAPTSNAMRGWRVEVNSDGVANLASKAALKVVNDAIGTIKVDRGNITMAGMAINQNGLASASTSVTLNGSVILKARDVAEKTQSDFNNLVLRDGGQLVLGEGSTTKVEVVSTKDKDGNEIKAAKTPAFKPSTVELLGKTIELGKDATIYAPSGNVTITAKQNFSSNAITKNDSRVVLGEGSLIDVSGSTNAELSMESNVLTAELRGGELADNPLLKNAAGIRGEKVRFDKRKAAGIKVANIQGYVDQAEESVSEKASAGGTVIVKSEGDIIQRARSSIDVSGGYVRYTEGYANTSKLTFGNSAVDFETASADRVYDGIVNPSNSSSNFEQAYIEAKSAGSVEFIAPAMSLQGDFKGSAAKGIYQRDNLALGGSLRVTVGLADDVNGNIAIGDVPVSNGQVKLDVAALNQAGFSRFSFNAIGGDIDVLTDLTLSAGSSLNLATDLGNIHWRGKLTLHGGSLTASANRGALVVADGSMFDMSGLWQNDLIERQAAPTSTLVTKGGSVRLTANQLSIGDNVAMDVSGGAWLNNKGAIKAGSAGSIALHASVRDVATDASLKLGQDLNLKGYGVFGRSDSSGGTLSLQGRNIWLGGSEQQARLAAVQGDLFFGANAFNDGDAGMFSQGGFANTTIAANGNLSIASNTYIAPKAQARLLDINHAMKGSGSMSTVSSVTPLDNRQVASALGQWQASNLTLTAGAGQTSLPQGFGVLTMAQGAQIQTDAGAKVVLQAAQNLNVNGTIDAPAGSINLLLAPINDVFDSSRSVWLGQHARLLAKGSTDRLYVDARGVTVGDLLDGGNVTIGSASTTGAVSGFLVAKAGSQIDVSGVKVTNVRFKSGTGTITAAKDIGSAGGSIQLGARDGMLWAGDLKGDAGNDEVRAGSLHIFMGRTPFDLPLTLTFNNAAAASVVPSDLAEGQSLLAFRQKGLVSTGSFANGGFSNVKLSSTDALAFDGRGKALSLDALGKVELSAQVFKAVEANDASTTVNVLAPYVSLGNGNPDFQTAQAASSGSSTLNIHAKTIDLIGNSATQGFGQVNLNAQSDIRLSGLPSKDEAALLGQFNTGKLLTITAAQIYPTTLSQFRLGLSGTDSTLRFNRNGEAPAQVFSAAGSLFAQADHIVQNGRVVAPFGSIEFKANQDIRYEAGSVTSVAGQGTVPFGVVENGNSWLYGLGEKTIQWSLNPNTDQTSDTVELALPEKAIVSSAPEVFNSSGATLDLSGGGQLFAYEFLPGPGGSVDVLNASAAGNSNQNFAINVNFKSDVAPIDRQYGNAGLKVGDQVWLSDGKGLQAGYYTLLPAHYALLDGGYAIEQVANTKDMMANGNRVNADASMVIAGYRRSSTDGRQDARWSGFKISPQSLINQRSEFKSYDADTFFSQQAADRGLNAPALPKDGGHAKFSVERQLQLDGAVLLGGAVAKASQAAGAKGLVDIAAPQINIVANRAANSGGYVQILANDLSALDAGSLLIGGSRTVGSDGVHITAEASIVRVDNDAAHPLEAAEIMLAAKNVVQLTDRSAVEANEVPGRSSDVVLIDAGSNTDADGALLRLSGGKGVAVQRATASGNTGRLEIGKHASLLANSIELSASASMQFNGLSGVSNTTSVSIDAPQISLGNAIPSQTQGVVLDADTLASLNRFAALTLSSSGDMDVYGTANLGRAGMDRLAIKSAGLMGHDAQVDVLAKTVQLAGQAGAQQQTPLVASSNLNVRADTLELGDGSLQVAGFSNTQFTANNGVVATGAAGRLVVDQALTITAPRFIAKTGASQAISSTGAVSLKDLSASATPASATTAAAGLGGTLSVEGKTLNTAMDMSAQSGQIKLKGQQGLTVASGTLDVSGRAMAFGSGTAYAPAGAITLDGGLGNVMVAKDATLNLSAQGATAGTLIVLAQGENSQADIKGNILANTTPVAHQSQSPTQASFLMDVTHSMAGADFASLNRLLNQAGFGQSRQFQFKQGNIEVAAGDLIKSSQVKLATDNGDVTIGGTLDASGAKGGTVEIYAARGVSSTTKTGNIKLLEDSLIDARATQNASSAAGSIGDGGRVVLGVSSADGLMRSLADSPTISANAGAIINVAGLGEGQDGTVDLRAPRAGGGAGTDVAIGTFRADIIGSRDTRIEAYKVYTAESISERLDSTKNLNASLDGKMAREAVDFMRNTPAMNRRLGRNDLTITAGIEVQSDADLKVSVNEQAGNANARGWNLNTWRFGGQASSLTLRAARNLTIEGSISDGFIQGSSIEAMPNWRLSSSPISWSYRLVGGSHLQAANPLGVALGGSTGDVKFAFARDPNSGGNGTPVALVRTGTGRIDVAAAGNVVFDRVTRKDPDGDTTADRHFGASVYTAGYANGLQSGFIAPLNNSNATYGSGASTSAQFGVLGGGISISAQGDVVGAALPQLVNNWLFRQGRTVVGVDGLLAFDTVSSKVQNTAMWVRPDYFNQSIGTLGGGDVVVNALGSIKDLSVGVASNMYVPGASPVGATMVEHGGGDLMINAGGDIAGGSFYVQKGQAKLHANEAVKAGSLVASDILSNVVTESGDSVLTALRPVFALGDATLDVTAGKGLDIETVYNPTLTGQNLSNAKNISANNLDSANAVRQEVQLSAFSTYSDDTRASLMSVTGDVLLSNNHFLVGALGSDNLPLGERNQSYAPLYNYMPSQLEVVALSGQVSSLIGFAQASAPMGQLSLLAGKSVIFGNKDYPFSAIKMLDNDPSVMSTALQPYFLGTQDLAILDGSKKGLDAHTATGLHSNDAVPVRVVAQTGSIIAPTGVPTTLSLPKQAEIIAGQDIVELGFAIQHNQATDHTSVIAGRDFKDEVNLTTVSEVSHVVTGPGLLTFQAGRNIDLANSYGVISRGNLDNPYLPEGGASVMALAGVASTASNVVLDSFEQLKQNKAFFNALVLASKYESLAKLQEAASNLAQQNPTALIDFDAAIVKAFPAYFESVVVPTYTQDDLKNAEKVSEILKGYDTSFKRAFGSAISSNELASDKISVKAFDAVLSQAFPKAFDDAEGNVKLPSQWRAASPNPYLGAFDQVIQHTFATANKGNINMFASQFKTEQGGSIDLLAPGGSVVAGLVTKPSYASGKRNGDADLGIFTVRGGDVRIFVKDDFLVNQSRVFTLGGGDITMISQNGDIDAGRGTKTASSAPPPLLKTDKDGNTTLDISGSISGSGIATLKTSETQPDSNIAAIAPRGIFDAGDAGVRSTGTVSIQAALVLNASNISAGGGVNSSVSLGTAPVASAAPTSNSSAAQEASKQLAVAPKDTLSLTVEVLGYGEESDDEEEEKKKRKREKNS
jgi:filamentous hemagglutinin